MPGIKSDNKIWNPQTNFKIQINYSLFYIKDIWVDRRNLNSFQIPGFNPLIWVFRIIPPVCGIVTVQITLLLVIKSPFFLCTSSRCLLYFTLDQAFFFVVRETLGKFYWHVGNMEFSMQKVNGISLRFCKILPVRLFTN